MKRWVIALACVCAITPPLAVGSLLLLAGAGSVSALASTECQTTQGTLPGGVPQPYNNIFTEAANYYHIPPALEAAIFMSEHGNTWPNPNAVQDTSYMGAQGWFQFIPSTWETYKNSNPNHRNGEVQNLADSAYAAAHYLSDLGANPNMQPGNPDAPAKGTVAWVAGSYNGGAPKKPGEPGYSENHPYMINAVQKFIAFSQGGFSGSPAASQAVSKTGSVYVLGDSIALGANQDLLSALGTQYSSAYVNASKSRSILGAGVTPGFTTSGLQAIKDDAKKVNRATAVIIELGTNDLHGGAGFESSVDRLINAVRNIDSSLDIYWVEIFSDGPVDKGSLNASLRNRASADGFQIIPMAGQGIELGSDNVHPTAAGSAKFAQLVAGMSSLEQVSNVNCSTDENAAMLGNSSAAAVAKAATDLENMRIDYVYGGGHVDPATPNPGLDCSSSVSWVLQHAGFKIPTMDSTGFMSWGDPGPGKYVTIYATTWHVFMKIGGRYFGTSGFGHPSKDWGPAWFDPGAQFPVNYISEFTPRHPPGM
jgi:lysophospholipase L1-like esterase